MTVSTTTTARMTTAQAQAATNARLDTMIEALNGLTTAITGLVSMQAGQHVTPAAVVAEITSAPSARGRKAAKASAPKAAARKAAAPKADKPKISDAQRAANAAKWAAHKEIRSLVNKAFSAAGVKFTAGTTDRYVDVAAVEAMLAKLPVDKRMAAVAFVAEMAAKHNAA